MTADVPNLTEEKISPVCAIGSTIAATGAVGVGGTVAGILFALALIWLGLMPPGWLLHNPVFAVCISLLGVIGSLYLINRYARSLYPRCRRRYGR